MTKADMKNAYMIGRVAVAEIQNLIVAYKERFDKSTYTKSDPGQSASG